jgi:hypothetical protein
MPYWGTALELVYIREEVAEAAGDDRVTLQFCGDEGKDFLNWAVRVAPEHALNRILETNNSIKGGSNLNGWGTIDTANTDLLPIKIVALCAWGSIAGTGERFRCRRVEPTEFFHILDSHEVGDLQYHPPNAIWTWDQSRRRIIFLGAPDDTWTFAPSFVPAATVTASDKLLPHVSGWRNMIRNYITARWLDTQQRFQKADTHYALLIDEMAKLGLYFSENEQTHAAAGHGYVGGVIPL